MKARSILSRWKGEERGFAVLEFALLTPVVLVILAGTADLGTVLYARVQVDSAVNAAANYALVNASSVSSSGASSMASSMASYVNASLPGTDGGAAISVNNGANQTAGTGASVSGGSTASAADSCYCPSGSGATVTWGSATTCGSSCPNGGFAGKFVVINAHQPFTPMFSNWGIISAGAISMSAVVQVQ
jgi:Flp pilus assembly protein TadG